MTKFGRMTRRANKKRRLPWKGSAVCEVAVCSVTSGGSRKTIYARVIMRETQPSLTSGLRWNLEIEKNADAHGDALLPGGAEAAAKALGDDREVRAEIVGLNSPGDVRAPLDIHAAAAHDAEVVE